MDNHRWVQEWTDHKYLQPHVFDDVKAQIPPGTLDESASFQKRKAQCEKCNFRKTAFCHVHNKECSLEDPADLNVSGLPCQDNSRANLNRLFLVDGKHGSVYLVWARKHRLARTPLLILENTPETRFSVSMLPDFDCSVFPFLMNPKDIVIIINLVTLCGTPSKDLPIDDVARILPEYDIYPLRVGPEDVGHTAVRRERVYVFCCHHETGEYQYDLYQLYDMIKKSIGEVASTRCRDYFISTPTQINVHSHDVCRKRKLQWTPVACWH